jgi:hypothetical protein
VYRQALGRFPLSLALRFNFVRAALHFGEEADIAEALSILKATLDAGMRPLTLQPLDDLMTWDYCQSFFNYRDYLQIVTEALRDGSDRRDEMKRLVFASMHYYYGRMAGEPGHFEQAATLDPGFTMYRLWQGKELIRNGDTASAVAAIPVLSGVVRDMLCAPEAWTLLQAIRNEHGLDIPDEAELHRLADRMERRTIIDEGYVGIRLGPYFRQQRLSLGRNHRGYELRKADERPGGRRLSILLSDTNGSRYPALLDSLSRQTLPRGDFEVICADIFDRESPAAMAQADTVIVFGQNEHLYNRNVGFNTGLILARGDTVAYMDRDVALPDTALADWLALAEAAGPNGVLVNPYGGSADEHSVHTVMLRRDAAIAAGGLDESAYYAGAYSGPHELVPRAQAMGWTLHALEETFGAVAPVASPHGPAAMTLSGLLHDVWPSKFALDRTDPLRTNPDVNPLKSAAE